MGKIIGKSKELTKRGNPRQVKKICEWTGDVFWVDWKYRNARFKDMKSMYEWRKDKNQEVAKCKNCGNEFKRYKNINHHRTGIPTQYCSNHCSATSNEKIEKLKKWANSDKNHFNKLSVQNKVKKTKLERYGSENYNNIEQAMQTNTERYGTPLPMMKTSNGKTISKGQRSLYNDVKQTYKDAKLEHFLKDVNKSVDIYVPSTNTIIEYFGDYWHCNPEKYHKDYYHTQVHKTAQQIWDYDSKRLKSFEENGYTVILIWERDYKNGYLTY